MIFRDGQRTYVGSPEDLFSLGIDVDDSMLINLGLEKISGGQRDQCRNCRYIGKRRKFD